jgi:hypothetical protein
VNETFLAISFLFISLRLSGFGIGDWQHETPGANLMEDPGSGTQLTIRKTGEKLLGIKRWYFYKDFIVGESADVLFILDENRGEKLIYNDREKWTKEIQLRGLKPFLWTRWYTDNWVDGDWLLIWLYFGFIVSIPLTLFFLFALYQVIVKERFRLTSFYTIFVLSVAIGIGMTLLLDHYPCSI